MPGLRRGSLFAALILSLLAVLIVFLLEPLWTPLEQKSYDLRVNLSRALSPTTVKADHVVVIGISDQEILEKKPFIFWYPDLGRLMSKTAQAQPAAIGCDLIPYHSLEQKLAESLTNIGFQSSGRTELAAEELGRRLDASLVAGLIETSQKVPFIQGVSGSMVPYYYDLMAFMANARPASLQVKADPDGTLRQQQFETVGEIETFPAALYRAGMREGNIAPLPQSLKINFALFDQIPRYSFSEVMSESFPIERLAGKIILVGLLSRIDDVHRTPLGERSGVLIHATTIETLITHTELRSTPPLFNYLAGFLLTLAVFLLIVRRSLPRGALLVTGIILASFLCSLAFFAHGIVLPLTALAALPVVIFSLCAMYRFGIEARERRNIYQTFSYYVDTRVIDKIISQGRDKIMEGEEHEACIMFLDIRGFTEMSAQLPAASIVAMLNVFFGKITEIIQENQGLVNKFIGDGMLAFFIAEEGSVNAALQSSVEICRAIEEMNRQRELADFVGERQIAIGIGLHAGRIILGNIGSRRKLDFTVIGQPVNMASRIEAMTKHYGRRVLVSRTVSEQAGGQFRFERVGEAGVKGIEGRVEFFALDLSREGITEVTNE